MPSKGMKQSEEVKKRITLVKTKNRKCSVDGCDKPHSGKGFCKNHYLKFKRETDPEWKNKVNEKQLQAYYDDHENRKERKRIDGKTKRAELYLKLGGKCVSCGEKFDPKLKISNLAIHHKFYDEEDIKAKKKFKGSTGSRQFTELIRMFKTGIDPNKKFTLLCHQCNLLEGWVRVNPEKAFDTFAWLVSEGYFDKAMENDPSLKKITEFLK